MRNPDWVVLTDAERGQLVAMWLLAADHNGVIPASPQIVQKLCFMGKPPNMSKFQKLGFLDANVTPTRRHGVTPKAETETEAEKNRDRLMSDFTDFWSCYPKKIGKKYAVECWKKASLPPIEKILNSIEQQKKSIPWKQNNGRYIPNPSTWINQGRWDDELPVEKVSTFFDNFEEEIS